MKSKTLIYIGIILLVLIGGFMLSKQPAGTSEEENEVQLTGETKEFTIEAFRFGFNPNNIEVNLGDKVRITAYSRDVPHGLAINEFNVNMYLTGSTPQTVEFIADKKGTFTFFCNIPCGAGHSSMRGRLIVR